MSDLTQIPRIINPDKHSHKVLWGTPTLGKIRMEWATSKEAVLKPTLWANSTITPYYYPVAEGRNECVKIALKDDFDWIFFHDDDVILPMDTAEKMRYYMTEGKTPVMAGIYYCKASRPEPLMYRGRGVGPYYNWEFGDKVWVDGIHMGLVLIHTSLFRAMKPPWFETPRISEIRNGGIFRGGGTEDIFWCDRVINEGILKKAGWEVPDPKNPFLVDTSIFAQHIDLNSGRQYPSCAGDEWTQFHEMARKAEQQRERRRAARAA